MPEPAPQPRPLSIPAAVFYVLAAVGLVAGFLGLISGEAGRQIAIAGIGGALTAFAVASVINSLHNIRLAIEAQTRPGPPAV